MAYQRLASLRAEADGAVERAEAAEGKCKKLEQEILNKDQEIQSLTHRLTVTDGQLEDAEKKLGDAKSVSAEHESSKTTNEGLQRKVQLLEEELDSAEKNLKETVERYVRAPDRITLPPISRSSCGSSIQAPSDGSEGRALRTPGAHLRAGEGSMGEEIRSTVHQPILVFSAHILSVYRKSSQNIRSPRKSSTNSSPAWKGCNRVAIFVFSFVCAASGSQYLSEVADVVGYSLVDLLHLTNSRKADDYPICILHDHFSGSMNNIHSHYFLSKAISTPYLLPLEFQ